MKTLGTQASNQDSKTTENSGLNVLLVNASSRLKDSVTRNLTESLLDQLKKHHGVNKLTVRDVAALPLPTINERWIEANFTRPENRDEAHRSILAQSDALVDELKEADVIILGAPVYNFSVPASLKAWVDLVARAGLTFKYTDNGPVGLLEGKQAFVVVASGGTPIGSEIDFASPYLRHVLSFIGITDVKLVTAERLNVNNDASKQQARLQIEEAVSEFNIDNVHAA